ncbi:LysM peptidoglycan-binding domain-containing protein [Winogradskyella litoriviva]|uniref:LysM peptidoglycan-binding domain-containing protein n=1 Tax=Winogradskyella litoriviva TaxID=1220182 RepID=A0ABX2E8C4_9FLAO|nr:LysM peptidoglycan-binding domain-containing protein [Winogradskyella litoriviva]NRD24690.1 LysM peptidoglycan-binding domain-containing protein [Winogradskyella litoriviva]
MGKFFMLVIVLVFGSNLAIAQQDNIVHSIQKGESVYQISRQYGVSINAIFDLNPGSRDIIYAGETLLIPNSSNNTSSTSTQITSNGVSNYEVQRGETKSGLSRRFGVSIAMLEQQNPHIVNMLQAGHIINVDKSITEQARTARQGEHIVVKGETLWGIARQNGISVAQLEAANANQLSEFLQIGQTLIIPDKNSVITNPNEYLVVRGDTKFELARRFNMTIAELEAQNPHIIDMLMAGHKLNINKSESNAIATTTENNSVETPSVEVNNPTTNGDYIDYTIQAKETLYGLSRKAGMTMEELMVLNPSLRVAVNKGDIIKMPRNPSAVKESEVVTLDNTSNEIDINVNNRNASLFSNLNTTDVTGLYFYTPFSSQELSSPEERQKMVNADPNKQFYIDFFQGAQIAIDSAKSLNIDFDVALIKKNIAKSSITINSNHKKNALLIPFLDNASHFSEVISNEEVSVIDIESNIVSTNNTKVYKSFPTNELERTKALNYLALQNARVIVISELEESKNKALIQSIIPNAKFLKVDNSGNFGQNALDNTLSTIKPNFVILDSEKTSIFLNSTTALMSRLSNYDIQLVLLESALIPKQNQVSDMRFRVLKLIFPSILDPQNKKDIKDFERSYEDIFEVKPSKHAVLGFDITLDVLLRLAQDSSFESTINNVVSEHPHLRFEYKKSDESNYLNTGLHLLQYNSNEGLIEID